MGAGVEQQPSEKESLEKEIGHIEQEARMVLPGIQALFGFQLIAVFNQRFGALGAGLQHLHLAALLCTSVATLCVLTPAAYHRLAEPGRLSERLSRIGSRALSFGMMPLMVGICLDLHVIARTLGLRPSVSAAISLGMLAAYGTAWFAFPLLNRSRAGPAAEERAEPAGRPLSPPRSRPPGPEAPRRRA